MNATEHLIRRPVLSTVLSLVLILIGVVTWQRLQVRQYPQIDQPRISIKTDLEGASADIVEAQITKPLENALAGVEGVDFIRSSSEVGSSRITMLFKLSRSIEDAANDVRDRISRIRDKFPQGTGDPVIKKADADALPFMYLALSSDRHPAEAIADYAKRVLELENEVESLSGVSSAEVTGGGDVEMRIVLDPLKMASYKITTDDIIGALKKQNVEKPAGHFVTTDREIVLTTTAPLKSEQDFNDVILRQKQGAFVRLRDVGNSVISADDTHFRNRFNDRNAVVVNIIKQSTANPLVVAQLVKDRLPGIQEALPSGMTIEVAFDETIFIERSIAEVYETIFIAAGLVIVVVLLFLTSLRAALIPIVTIPISLIATFAIMYALGFTVNVLTLLALVLAIGLVVDDAIVMLENIYRYVEEGMDPFNASIKGAQEISFAVIAMTMTLAAVYAPIALSTGLTGLLFTEFAVTLAGAVIVSGFIALTLSPMMCSRLLRPHRTEEELENASPWTRVTTAIADEIEFLLQALSKKYSEALRFSLSNKRHFFLIGGAGAMGVFGWLIAINMKSELVPQEDQGIVKVRGAGPYDASLSYVDRYMRQLDKILDKIEDVDTRLLLIQSPGESFALNQLKPWENRSLSSREIVDLLRDKLTQIPGLSMTPYAPRNSLVQSSNSEYPIQLVIQTTKSHKELIKMTEKLRSALGKLEGIVPGDVWPDYSGDGQQYTIEIQREKAAQLGVELSAISEMLNALIGRKVISHFKQESKRFNVRLEVDKKFRHSPDDLSNFFVRGNRGGKEEVMVPLSELVTLKHRLAPIEIRHFGGLRAATLRARVKPGASFGDTLERAKLEALKISPEGTRIDYAGESRRYVAEQASVYLIYGLAIIFIFLVLAAQYESYVDPLIILSSVPLSITGGLLFLWLAGGTMNLFSQIGLVTLIGLITKHGILLVDFANSLRDKGLEKVEAVIESAKRRLRPILMTTFAMVIGAIPLALADGAGAESRQQIGWVIVGGMAFGTLFTLFVVPAFYLMLSRARKAIP